MRAIEDIDYEIAVTEFMIRQLMERTFQLERDRKATVKEIDLQNHFWKCDHVGCDRRAVSKNNYCIKHYKRWKKYGTTADRPHQKSLCSLPNCERFHYGRGLCKKHYDVQSRKRQKLLAGNDPV